ncbi:cyclodeaminase/cyclohydrolase family protein [Microbacterium sp. cx-59]|uniref:cyclodeaminase/cyclohydrolase family protein n=1 Tax=Microbacterium sp. cx-59 TaxID=2891207 RepID=UPI001E2BE412|nr:cyclodeaminase/cyclohydrolase family protein [Microbacterium sp. cx-59]MCC4907929.1 cyclodeaminase/cyclohydrolase family protein [Microbacterium sp. cx-59]
MTHPGDDASTSPLAPWLERLAAPEPAPGGGAAAAVTLAIGAAVLGMTAGYAPAGADRTRALDLAAETRQRALVLADRDAAASAALVAAFRLPDGAAATAARAEALREATVTSLDVAGLGVPLPGPLAWLAEHGEPMLAPDVVVAGHTLAAGVRSAAVTARSNLTAATTVAVAEGSPDETLAPLRARVAEAILAADALDAIARGVASAL